MIATFALNVLHHASLWELNTESVVSVCFSITHWHTLSQSPSQRIREQGEDVLRLDLLQNPVYHIRLVSPYLVPITSQELLYLQQDNLASMLRNYPVELSSFQFLLTFWAPVSFKSFSCKTLMWLKKFDLFLCIFSSLFWLPNVLYIQTRTWNPSMYFKLLFKLFFSTSLLHSVCKFHLFLIWKNIVLLLTPIIISNKTELGQKYN